MIITNPHNDKRSPQIPRLLALFTVTKTPDLRKYTTHVYEYQRGAFENNFFICTYCIKYPLTRNTE